MSPLMLAQKFPLATLMLSPFPMERFVAQAACECISRNRAPKRNRRAYVAMAVTTALYCDEGHEALHNARKEYRPPCV